MIWGEKTVRLRDGGLAWGATNSGKTYGLSNLFSRYACAHPGKHLLIGSNLALLRAEVIPDIRHHARRHGWKSTDYSAASGGFRVGRSRVIVRAGIKAGDEERLRSIHGILSMMAEEVSSIPEMFYDFAVSRMSLPFGPIWASCNPAGPTNWVKQRLDEGRWPHDEMFLLDDNPALTDEQREEFANQFVGTFYKRMIAGLWVAPEGLVYPHWQQVAPDAALVGRPCWVGADYGESNVTCAVYVQVDPATGRYVVTREYYYDAYKQGARDGPGHAAAIIANAPGPISGVCVDPSARDLKAALRAKLLQVHNGYNKIDGYGVVDGLLQRGLLVIVPAACPELTSQLYALVWNRYGDHPDPNCIDHATDALRYVGYSLRGASLYGSRP